MVGSERENGAVSAVHLTADEGVQAYTEPHPRLARDGSNRGPFLPGRSVVNVTAVSGDWASVTVDGSPVGWVSASGLVPPLGPRGGTPPAVHQYSPAPAAYGGATIAPAGNGMAVTALVLGVLAAAFAFTFFLGLLAFPLAVLAIIFGRIGLTRSRTHGVGSGQSIAGLILGIVAVVVCAYWFWVFGSFFRSVTHAIDQSVKSTASADPVANRVTLKQCNTTINRAEAGGTLVNTDREMHNLTVMVTFYGPGGKSDSMGTAYGVAPGATASWFAQGPAVTQLSGCSLGLSSNSTAPPPSTLVAGPPR